MITVEQSRTPRLAWHPEEVMRVDEIRETMRLGATSGPLASAELGMATG